MAHPLRRSSGDLKRQRRRPSWLSVRGKRTFAGAALASVLGLVLGLVPAVPAAAAGQPVAEVTITDANGVPIDSVVPVTSASVEYQVRVSYTCTGDADCTNMTVAIAAPPKDPYYDTYRKESGSDWIAPFSPAPPITGDLASGYTVRLGTVAAGATGTIVFRYFLKGPVGTPGSQHTNNLGWGNFFPPGFGIDPQVTVTADSAAPVNVTDHATYDSVVPTPSLVFNAPGSVKTDTPMTVTMEARSGCWTRNGYNTLKAQYNSLCSTSGSVAVKLPAEAVWVSGSGGTYDADSHTVTVTAGPDAWYGLLSGAFQVTFPRSAYPETGEGCFASEAFEATGSVTYLNGVVKATTPVSQSRTTTVDNCQPFMKGTFNKGATAARYKIPTTTPTTGPYWQVDTYHQGNKPGVVTVVDDTLDQPGMPVSSISTSAGATIRYTLDGGTTGEVTGTTYTAPTGRRIVKATVVSSPLAGPNLEPSGTASTRFWVRYFFSVMPGATPEDRVNTASATISYPDYPEIAPFTPTGSPDSQTVTLYEVEPFAKASVDKYSNAATYPVQAASYGGSHWVVDVCNQSNVDGVATVTDTFDQAGLPVYHIRTNVPATVTYTLDNGTTATVTGTDYAAPTGRSIVKATVVSPTLPGPNATSAGTGCSLLRVIFYFRVEAGAAAGERVNTASATMTYPNTDLGTVPATGSPDTHTVNLYTNTPYTIEATSLSETNNTSQNANPRAGDEVVWSANARFCNLATDRTITPQYIFVAPRGWNILPDGATLVNVPGATFAYKTISYEGVPRNAVIVQWPTGVAGVGTGSGSNCAPLSQLSVKTSPTLAAPAGAQSAHFFVGDVANATAESYSPTRVNEAATGADIDTDGTTTDSFALRADTVIVQGVPGLNQLKEICQPDSTRSDGCNWLSDPAVTVGVPPNATSIKYRVTIRNTGQTDLTNVVVYDVLPYPNDVGTSDASAGVSRGSTVKETLSSLTADSPTGMTFTYSTSTNPPRSEVYSGPTTGDWNAPLAGASAIRATIPTLSAGTSRTFTYEAALVGAAADQTACNSLAVKGDTLVTSEPPRVCASTQEADFEIAAADRLPLQADRLGVVPFAVTNKGGSALASGVVSLRVPAGLTMGSLSTPGWSCAAEAPTGPTTVECKPVQPDGMSTRELAKDATETISLRVRPSAGAAELCVDADVESSKFDPEDGNNTASACASVVTGPELQVTKDDDRDAVAPGDTYTYTITLANRLVAEALPSATLTDTLPAGLQLVETSPAATVSGQTVTWQLGGLNPAGVESADGDIATGGAGSTTSVTVTVKALPSLRGEVVNTARATAPDPVDAARVLSAEGTDTDDLQRSTVTKSSDAAAAGVRSGDLVTYTVTLRNDGTADYTESDPARLVDDLSDVLDDATFVEGSAEARIDGGSATPVADPLHERLSWSGPVKAGSAVTLTYQVTVGEGQPGDVLTNTAYAAGSPSSCTDGLTPDSDSCARVTTQFAPTLAKVVKSSAQNDDGTWTTVYSVVVTNTSPTAAATYTLNDALAFGAGISVVSAAVTSAPEGVATTWSGSGPIATGVTIPANTQHAFEITAVADAGTTGGTPAGTCTSGVAGGFANRATLATSDGRTASAEACAAPVEPTVDKVVAPASQLADGRFRVEYTVTVSNAHAVDLPYTLDDKLAIPAGIAVDQVTVEGPTGAPVNPAFNGTDSTALLTGADRIPAGSADAPATRVFTVALIVDAGQSGSAGASALACAPAGSGGYRNVVDLHAGTSATVLDTADACTNAVPLPMPEVTKRVISTALNGDGDWTIVYDIAVKNPDATYSTRYSLQDELRFAEGVTVLEAEVTSSEVTVSNAWDGEADTAVTADQALPAATTHTYTVTVLADPGAFDAESAAADCRLDAGETATGFSNLTTVTSGVKTAFASACEPINDPSAVKTTAGQPTQDPETGVWTLQYDITVKNRSTTTAGTVPYTLTDELGFPADVAVLDVSVEAPDGVIVNDAFDGESDTTIAEAGIGRAASETAPATQVYTVTVEFTVPAGLSEGVACDPAQGPGGLFNEVELAVGSRISGAVACANVPDVPLPGLTKTVLSQEQQADGTWELLYQVTVANPSATAASEYALDDEFALGEGMTLEGAPSVVTRPEGVTVEPDFDGGEATTIAEEILLPAGGAHTYTVRAVVDAGSVSGDDPAGDCTLDADEAGTGFGNTALLDSGVAASDTIACARAWDPGVTKELNGRPVQQSDGSWLLSYTMTVTNPSPVRLSYGLEDELAFPSGTDITIESAAGRPGSPSVEADWDGQAQLQLVADGTALPAGAMHVFDVTVRALLPEDQGSVPGGWVNTATVRSGVDGVIETAALAEADILVPRLAIAKEATPSEPLLRIGDTVDYAITLENVGEGDFTALYPAVVWDALADVLDDGDIAAGPDAAPMMGGVTFTGDAYRFSSPLVSGETATITYTVAVADHDGDADLVNVAYVSDLTGDLPSPPAAEDCDTDTCAVTQTPLAALQIDKSASAAVAAPGDSIMYTVTVTNSGQADIPAADPAVLTDDLTGVLDAATYNGDAAADEGSAEVSGATLTWTGGLEAGESATITYSVTVKQDAPDGAELVNVAMTDPTLLSVALGGGATEEQVTTLSRVHRLAVTGADGWGIGIGIAFLLLVGGCLLLFARRRRRSTE